MNNSTKFKMLLSSIVLALPISAYGQQTNDVEALQRRMNSLERKVDLLIDLMQKQQAGSILSDPSSDSNTQSAHSTSDGIPEGYVSGMYLDVFGSGISFDGNEKFSDIQMPEDLPSASVAIPADSSFSYDQFQNFPNMKSFAESGESLVGVSYSSYFIAKSAGEYVFQLDFSAKIVNTCLFQLYIADKRLISSGSYSSLGGGGKSKFMSAQSKVNLSPGLYDLKTYFVCSTYRGAAHEYANLKPSEFSDVKANLLVAEPGDHAPRPIPVDKLLIKQ